MCNEVLPQHLEGLSLEDENESGLESERIEDEDGFVPVDPVKMNETLEPGYILKFEPFENLPSTYYPIPSLSHRPPLFYYGYGFSSDELVHYAINKGLYRIEDDEDEESRLEKVDVCFKGIFDITRTIREDFGVSMHICAPYSRTADIVLCFWTNYCNDTPPPPGRDKVFAAMDKVEEMLRRFDIAKCPMWYISEDKWDNPRSGYGAWIDFTRFRMDTLVDALSSY